MLYAHLTWAQNCTLYVLSHAELYGEIKVRYSVYTGVLMFTGVLKEIVLYVHSINMPHCLQNRCFTDTVIVVYNTLFFWSCLEKSLKTEVHVHIHCMYTGIHAPEPSKSLFLVGIFATDGRIHDNTRTGKSCDHNADHVIHTNQYNHRMLAMQWTAIQHTTSKWDTKSLRYTHVSITLTHVMATHVCARQSSR